MDCPDGSVTRKTNLKDDIADIYNKLNIRFYLLVRSNRKVLFCSVCGLSGHASRGGKTGTLMCSGKEEPIFKTHALPHLGKTVKCSHTVEHTYSVTT